MPAWLHFVELFEGFSAWIPTLLHLWLALSQEFDLGCVLCAVTHHMLPVLEVALHLLFLIPTPTPFEDLAAEYQKQTLPLAPTALGSRHHR